MRFKKLKRKLAAAYGQAPDREYFDGDMNYIRSYHDFRQSHGKDEFAIDDITWNDLDMDRLFRRINGCQSSSGEMYLYHMLRTPALEQGEYDARKGLTDYFDAHAGMRLNVQTQLNRLGSVSHANLNAVFDPQDHSRKWLFIYILLILLIPLSIVVAALTRPLAWRCPFCALCSTWWFTSGA